MTVVTRSHRHHLRNFLPETRHGKTPRRVGNPRANAQRNHVVCFLLSGPRKTPFRNQIYRSISNCWQGQRQKAAMICDHNKIRKSPIQHFMVLLSAVARVTRLVAPTDLLLVDLQRISICHLEL